MLYTDKILLTAINSKYIHSNTAVYYLYNILNNSGFNVETISFTVNESKDDILGEIIMQQPEVVCFSCYIWNISLVYELCSDLRKINNKIKIILGGPEVSFSSKDAWEKSGADCIIRGEGENVFVRAVDMILSRNMQKTNGCFYMENGKEIDGGYAMTPELDSIPSPFNSYMKQKEQGKLIYYEASRGCPFSCIYCLSSAFKGVRYFSDERIFSDIAKILEFKPSTVKFTDRSFNIHIKKTIKILDFLAELETETCFHLEIYPAQLNEKVIEKLKSMPRGRIQIEAGIQSTNKKTLEMSGRPQDSEKALKNIEEIAKTKNIHIHLDLIAGLPGEDIKSFKQSFNRTIKAKPHMLQLGFLKLLKGTKAREIKGYQYSDMPPYEVISNPWISYKELLEIKEVAKCVDNFYNSGRFVKFVSYMHDIFDLPYEFYNRTAQHIRAKGRNLKGMSVNDKYLIMFEMAQGDKMALEMLRYDYMKSSISRKLPDFLGKKNIKDAQLFTFLRKTGNIETYLPGYTGMSAKKIFKKCVIEKFNFPDGNPTYLFDYGNKDPVTGLYPSIKIKL